MKRAELNNIVIPWARKNPVEMQKEMAISLFANGLTHSIQDAIKTAEKLYVLLKNDGGIEYTRSHHPNGDEPKFDAIIRWKEGRDVKKIPLIAGICKDRGPYFAATGPEDELVIARQKYG